MREQRTPTKITLDAYAASHRAVADPKTTGELPKRVKVRSSKSEQHHRTGSPAREASTWPDAGTEEFPNGGVVIGGVELVEKIKKGQFKIGKLGGTTATMSEIWRAALAA